MVQVGDRIRVLRDRANLADVKKGDEFIVKSVRDRGAVRVEGSRSWAFSSDNYEVIRSAPFKDPIEYLKTAHADGDMIDPATMLRECYGITKTERVVVEWSEPKEREIKVGDKVRIVGNKMEKEGFGHRFKVGEIVEITEVDPGDEQPYKGNGANMGWLAADDVELV